MLLMYISAVEMNEVEMKLIVIPLLILSQLFQPHHPAAPGGSPAS